MPSTVSNDDGDIGRSIVCTASSTTATSSQTTARALTSICADVSAYCDKWSGDCNSMFCDGCQMEGICDTTCSISSSSTCPTANESGCYQANDTQPASVCAQLSCDTVWVNSPGSCDQYCDICDYTDEPTCYVCDNFLPTDCSNSTSEIGIYCYTECSIDYCVKSSTATATTDSISTTGTSNSVTSLSATSTSTSITTTSGSTTSGTTTSGTTTSSSSGTTTVTPCVNVVPDLFGYTGVTGWVDSNGYDCDWYLDYDCFPDNDAATSFANYGMTASEACCACGGGMNGFSSTTMSETTTTLCEDWRPASEAFWYVGNNTDQDCGYVAYFCEDAIASVESFGRTATEACCYCGGGVGETSTRTTTTGSSSISITSTTSITEITDTFTTSSVTTTISSTFSTTRSTRTTASGTTSSTVTRCEDWNPLMIGLTENAWYDASGTAYTCDFYESNDLCGTGDDLENFNRTAGEACCACGGGVNIESTSTITATTTTQCVDMVPDGAGDYWYDSRGTIYSCGYYAHGDFCTSQGDLYSNYGYTAQEVCCVCGGGTGLTATNTTVTASVTVSTYTSTMTTTLSGTTTTFSSTLSSTSTLTTRSDTSSTATSTFSSTSSTSTTTSPTFSLSSSTSATTASGTSSRSETTTSTATLSSSTSLTASATSGTWTTATSCADYVPEGEIFWYDQLGEVYNCDWYKNDTAEYCGEFAAGQNPSFGRTANEACCACGGGVAFTATTTFTETTTTECFDWQPSSQEDWYDGEGNTCEYYMRELLVTSTCSESENFGMVADQACCVCGGGVGKTNTETSSSQTFSTTLSATTTSSATTSSSTSLPTSTVSTTLSGDHAAGVTELLVESEEGFGVGDTVLIEGGGNSETGTIAGFGSIVLSKGITNSYPSGSTVSVTGDASSVEEASASSLPFAVIFGLIAAGLLAAWIAGLSFLKFGCGYHLRTPKTHAKGHGPSRSPRRDPRARGRGVDIVFDRDSPVV